LQAPLVAKVLSCAAVRPLTCNSKDEELGGHSPLGITYVDVCISQNKQLHGLNMPATTDAGARQIGLDTAKRVNII